MNKNALTLTIVANMTSNFGEGLGNISSVQKTFRNGKVHSIRTRESLKNAIMDQSLSYEDLVVVVNKATQKHVDKELNNSNCRALEGGYMNTGDITYKRNSSFYLTDAVSVSEFVNDPRFHNNLYLASKFAEQNDYNLQNEAGKCGLMPYQYEYDKSLKSYSFTIDLERVGVDENFKIEAEKSEKCARVIALINAIEGLSLVVKGSLDNAEPLFVVGGLTNRKTHVFENLVKLEDGSIKL
ncbi:MAG: type I-B CRISPR-associated protein Cas7/Cst2/DevR, partial [Acidaminobacteraceae bacterium]